MCSSDLCGRYDRLVVITDEQSHDRVPGPRGRGYVINVASARNGVGYADGDRGWFHIDGFSEAVVEYIARDGRLQELYERLHALLDFLLPQYVAEGKAHLVVAIGCTGGRHRSVAITEHLARRYDGADGYLVEVVHRDVTRPA